MSTRVRHGWVRWAPAGLIVFLAVGASALAADPPELLALKKATADGKYTNLLAVIHMPGDKETYGEYKDYGAYNGTDWGGYKGLPKGNWVYVAPHWYIWEKEGKAGDALPLQQASAQGKYANLLAIIHMPGDKETYGEYKDYGPYNGTDWGGYKALPKGNWVYVYPRWYIWEKAKK
jgi:hypothetical protein